MCDTTGVTSISLRNPDLSPISSKEDSNHHQHPHKSSKLGHNDGNKQNRVGAVGLFGVSIVSLVMNEKERLCLAQISSTLLKEFSYNEIHNRRVALGITCVQCTPVELEILRRAGAMPVTSRRCGMITRREAERLCQSFLGDHAPPQLPENFAFEVYHECGWGSRGSFVPSRYNSSRAKCIRCTYCQLFFSPNKFIFHSHRLPESRYVQPDAANFNSWRRHLKLCGDPPDDDMSSNTLSMDTAQIVHAWEDVRAMFNGGTRKRMLAAHTTPHHSSSSRGAENHGQGQSHGRRTNGTKNSGSSGGNSSGGVTSKSPNTPTPPRHASHHHHHQNNNSNSNASHNSSVVNNPGYISPIDHPHHHPMAASPNNNNFLSSSNPLLSPTTRLENIWNPGLSPVNPSRIGNMSAACSQLPHLPFHPLSIPWLRRPLFPFPHPFAPAAACHLLADAGEKLATLSGVRPNQSAFKPVSRNAEHLFSWLNNNNNNNNNSTISGGALLPEDLSATSGHHHHLQGHGHSLVPIGGRATSPLSQDHSPVSSTNEEPSHHRHKTINSRRGHSNNNSTSHTQNNRHQVQILSSAIQNTSDDEENVDIESTEVEEEEECSSTSFIWVSSTNNNNNNNNNNKNSSSHKRRRLSVDSNSGCGSGEENSSSGESSPKRKRLWDFDSSESVKNSGKGVVLSPNCSGDETTRTSGFELSKD